MTMETADRRNRNDDLLLHSPPRLSRLSSSLPGVTPMTPSSSFTSSSQSSVTAPSSSFSSSSSALEYKMIHGNKERRHRQSSPSPSSSRSGASHRHVVAPSPSRSAILDRQYSARLFQNQSYRSSRRGSSNNSSSGTNSGDVNTITPPPYINRGGGPSTNLAKFRPSHIETITPLEESRGERDGEELRQCYRQREEEEARDPAPSFLSVSSTPERRTDTSSDSLNSSLEDSPASSVTGHVGGYAHTSSSRRSSNSFFLERSFSSGNGSIRASSPAANNRSAIATTPMRQSSRRRRHSSSPLPSPCSSVISNSSSGCYSDRFIPSRSSSDWRNFVPYDDDRRDEYDLNGSRGNGEDRDDDPTNHQDGSRHSESASSTSTVTSNGNQVHDPRHPPRQLLNMLLRSELLGENHDPSEELSTARGVPPPPNPAAASARTVSDALASSSSSRRPNNHGRGGASINDTNKNATPLRERNGTVLKFRSPRQQYLRSLHYDQQPTSSSLNIVKKFDLNPVTESTQRRLLHSGHGLNASGKPKRNIPKVPFKVLDAPALQDDFYLNLVDWSSQNVLAVGLGSCVYLWSAATASVTKLCDLTDEDMHGNSARQADDCVTSVSWCNRGTYIAVGTNRGDVQIWDATTCRLLRTMAGHTARVGTLAWTGPILASGSRDRTVYLRDVRTSSRSSSYATKLESHKQEVCGLKWSFDDVGPAGTAAQLASGGNDNKLLVWDVRKHHRNHRNHHNHISIANSSSGNKAEPLHRFADHCAAVKAIAWSPHQHGLLASGGGTADRTIRFYNTLSGAHLHAVDTGSQVCNITWSKNSNELVSTHGYSLNQIVLWKYPSMTKVATLTGHTYRVLYLAMSPDGSTICTGAGDETLRFWQVFPGPRTDKSASAGNLLFPNNAPGLVVR